MNQTKFTQQGWDNFGITELRMDDIVESGGVRFEPDEMGIEIKNKALAGFVECIMRETAALSAGGTIMARVLLTFFRAMLLVSVCLIL